MFKALIKTCLSAALLLGLGIALAGCDSEPVQTVAATPMLAPSPIVLVATPTPDLSATIAAAVVAAMPTSTPEPEPTPTVAPTPTPPPTHTPDPTHTVGPTATPDIPATVSAEMARSTPSPTPGVRPIADLVRDIDAGLVQITTPDHTGSGFVVSQDGLIVTNAHVVGEHTSVTVRFVDGTSLTGQVLGRDETVDLAVVKVASVLPLQPMTLGDAANIKAGNEVVALGFPLGDELGLDYTVTTGVVSAQRTYGSVDYIQTSARIYPGNSGGPLVGRDGRVIGMSTWVRDDHESIGFAISVSTVRQNLDSLASGVSVLAETDREWWTYENGDCPYRIAMHPNWGLEEENDECEVHFARYDGRDKVGNVIVWVYLLEANESLREFSESWRDYVVDELSRGLKSFELFSLERIDDSHEGYVMVSQYQESDEYCVVSSRDLIVQSSYYSDVALVIAAEICSFMPQSVFDEVDAMEFDY